MNAEMVIRKAINDGTHKLPNGALIIDWAYQRHVNVIVLAKFRGQFVTWLVGDDGHCYYGHYFDTIPSAVCDYTTRCAE